LLDLLSLLPLRGAARDLHSGSGLTANRTNLPNASELYPAFDWASRSPRPALGYRPLLALPPRFSAWRVTSLEPRTPHQPEPQSNRLLNPGAAVRSIFDSRRRSTLWRCLGTQTPTFLDCCILQRCFPINLRLSSLINHPALPLNSASNSRWLLHSLAPPSDSSPACAFDSVFQLNLRAAL